jgi:hypothetical protein
MALDCVTLLVTNLNHEEIEGREDWGTEITENAAEAVTCPVVPRPKSLTSGTFYCMGRVAVQTGLARRNFSQGPRVSEV